MFYETTEKVIDRRLSLNTWNYGVCIAMLIVSGVLANWTVSKSELRLLLLCGIGFVTLMGIFLCLNWKRQIKDLKLLNDAKFQVLNSMAPNVLFSGNLPSFQPFKKEWDILDANGAIVAKAGLRAKVLKSSGSEFLLPNAFAVLFAIITVLIVILCVANADTLLSHPFALPNAGASTDGASCTGNCS